MTSLTSGAAVITYNGLKYLPEQLDSILAQTRPVDHIVVSDDNSTDGTWEYLENWAKHAPVRVTIVRNQPNLGLTRNFEQACSMVEADIIFSSDQDDVWLPNKVELLMRAFEENPEVLLAHSDAILVDGNGKNMGTTLLSELAVSDAERRAVRNGDAFKVYCRRNLVTGATAAFRRSLFTFARPLPEGVFHDTWLALMAAVSGKVHMLEVPTIHYRQHVGNTLGVLVGRNNLGLLDRTRYFLWSLNSTKSLEFSVNRNLVKRQVLHERLAALADTPRPYRAMAHEAFQFATSRRSLSRNPIVRAMAVLGHASLGRYHRFSDKPWLEATRDMLNR
jgi:glycosyltransferase involved in cell wall biosynthesis